MQIQLFTIMNNKILISENIGLQRFWHDFILRKGLLMEKVLIYKFMLN